ncbi:MAG: MraY family glycosyltransferase, partial [Planctomycetota bacterium]
MSAAAQLICLCTAAAALLAGLLLTPLVRAGARRHGFVDRPDGGRKAHKEPVALGGGVVVAISALFGLTVAGLASWSDGNRLVSELGSGIRVAMFAAAFLILVLGLIDDMIALRGRYKLLGQVVACGILIAAGVKIETLSLLGVTYDLGWFATPFTLFWLLGAINAINLIDGIDGLAG